MRLVRLNKVIEVNDPDRIRDYKLLGYVEEGDVQPVTQPGREPIPIKPAELGEISVEKETRRGRPRTVNDL